MTYNFSPFQTYKTQEFKMNHFGKKIFDKYQQGPSMLSAALKAFKSNDKEFQIQNVLLIEKMDYLDSMIYQKYYEEQ